MKTGTIACSTRGKRRKIDLPYFPKEIIFNILIWLSAEFLHKKGKYVCKMWANIIRDPVFIKKHLSHANVAGLWIQGFDKPSSVRYLVANEGKIWVTRPRNPIPGLLVATCDGMLLSNLNDRLYVSNCVTMQVLKLPCLPSACRSYAYLCNIAYIPQTGDIKVLYTCYLDGHLHVLTVGTDMSWREIGSEFSKEIINLETGRTVSASGVIYFVDNCWKNIIDGILVVNLCDESVRWVHYPVPQRPEEIGKSLYGRPHCYRFLKMGDYLSCIVKYEAEAFLWMLKDFTSGEWVMIHKIECEDGKTLWRSDKKPIAWLDKGRILIFGSLKSGFVNLIAYNIKTGVTSIIKNLHVRNFYFILPHTNSLVSW